MDRYQSVFDALDLPMAIVYPDGVILSVNPAWRDLWDERATKGSLADGGNLIEYWGARNARDKRVRTAFRELASGERSGLSVVWPHHERTESGEDLMFRIRRVGTGTELLVSVEVVPHARGSLLRDPATGCLTREAFRERTGHALELVERRLTHARSKQLLVLALRFVGLEHVEDETDAQVGARVRGALADRLREGVRRADALAWLGGDAFGIAPVGIDHKGADRLEAGLRANAEDGIEVEGRRYRFPLRIARSAYPEDGSIVESLIYQAVTRARAPLE